MAVYRFGGREELADIRTEMRYTGGYTIIKPVVSRNELAQGTAVPQTYCIVSPTDRQ